VLKKKAKKAEAAAPPKKSIDLNSATDEELRELPGVGEAYSHRIIEGRPYRTFADLSKAGLPAATVARLEPMAVINPLPAAVDVNHATTQQLQTLPGIGPALAQELIAGRPYSGYSDVGKLRGIGPAKLDALRGRLEFGPATPAAKPKTKKAAATTPTNRELSSESKTAASEVKGDAAKVVESRRKAGQTTSPPKATRTAPVAPGTLINVNTASRETLDALFGIGPVKAQAIIDARPFNTIEDIMKVKGIKEGEFSKIKDRITVK
jgi:competence protein ComEA